MLQASRCCHSLSLMAKKGVLGLSPGKKCSHGSNVSGRKRLIGIFSLSIFLYNFDVLHWKVATSICLAFHVFKIQEKIIFRKLEISWNMELSQNLNCEVNICQTWHLFVEVFYGMRVNSENRKPDTSAKICIQKISPWEWFLRTY